MKFDLLGQMGATHYLLAGMVFLVCFLLIVIILLQKGRGGGLASAFGGGGNTAFGAKTGDVFTWITVGFAAFFILLAVFGNYAFRGPTIEKNEPLTVSSSTPSTAPTTQPATTPAPTNDNTAPEVASPQDFETETKPADQSSSEPDKNPPAEPGAGGAGPTNSNQNGG